MAELPKYLELYLVFKLRSIWIASSSGIKWLLFYLTAPAVLVCLWREWESTQSFSEGFPHELEAPEFCKSFFCSLGLWLKRHWLFLLHYGQLCPVWTWIDECSTSVLLRRNRPTTDFWNPLDPTFLSRIFHFDLFDHLYWPFFWVSLTFFLHTDWLLDPGWDLNQKAHIFAIFFQDFERFP